MMRAIRKVGRNKSGASLPEFALLFPLFSLLSFGILEVGYLMWQFQQGAIASKRAVRIAITRDLITPGSISDCGPNQPADLAAGTFCAAVPDFTVWLTCDGVADPAACGPDVADVINEINNFYPRSQGNVQIQLSGGALGFNGLGRPVPVVTVRFVGVQFEFIVLKGFGFGPVNMPALSSSAPAEDLTSGPT